MKRSLLLLGLFLAVLLLFAGCAQESATDEGDFHHDHGDGDDHGHEHGEEPYEWSGVYSFNEGTYIMHFRESGDPSVAVAFLFNEGDRDGSDHLAYHIMEVELEEVVAGGEFEAYSEFGYNLLLNPDGTEITFTISEAGDYLLYMEHLPEEFDLVITDSSGAELNASDEITY